jgi:uncharacterized protein YlzI (FlbEa/FlbD family)
MAAMRPVIEMDVDTFALNADYNSDMYRYIQTIPKKHKYYDVDKRRWEFDNEFVDEVVEKIAQFYGQAPEIL